MENVTKFGERLLNLREEREETQADLAKAIGITRQSLSRYETNERTPNIDLIFRVAKHYNVSADYLLGLAEMKSLDENIKIACKVTGLSEEAINVICTYSDDWKNILSELISFNFTNIKKMFEDEENELKHFKVDFSFVLSTINSFYKTYLESIKKCTMIHVNNNYFIDSVCDPDERVALEKKADELGLCVLDLHSKSELEMELCKNYFSGLIREIANEKVLKEESDNAQHNPKEE